MKIRCSCVMIRKTVRTKSGRENTPMERESNYEKVFATFRKWFVESNQEKTAKKLGLRMDDDWLYLPFFNEPCMVNRKNGTIVSEKGQPVSVTDRLTIMHHLHYYQEAAANSTKKIPFREIREAAVFEHAYIKSAVEPLVKAFSGCPEKLLQSGIAMGGRKEKYGDVSVTLQAFPKISLTYIFWDADEEFPASANILFDDQIARWTHPESVPVLAQTGTERLIEQAFGEKLQKRI